MWMRQGYELSINGIVSGTDARTHGWWAEEWSESGCRFGEESDYDRCGAWVQRLKGVVDQHATCLDDTDNSARNHGEPNRRGK